jgi:hypothetical protein
MLSCAAGDFAGISKQATLIPVILPPTDFDSDSDLMDILRMMQSICADVRDKSRIRQAVVSMSFGKYTEFVTYTKALN